MLEMQGIAKYLLEVKVWHKSVQSTKDLGKGELRVKVKFLQRYRSI